MVKKRFIADAEVLLSSVANKGEVDRRLAEMYGIAPDYAQKLRLAYIPEKDVTLNVTKGDNISIGPAKEIQLAKIKDPKKREKAKKEVFNTDSIRQERELAPLPPETRKKVEEKLEEVREKKKEMPVFSGASARPVNSSAR